MAYLSKSRFKQALSCPTKLYYGTKGNNYADNNADDPFMAALAEGGYQVGELAKFLVCNDPVGENITINELDYEKSLAQTKEKRDKGGKVVIAEAAFTYKDFFVRTDLFVEERDTIRIYEVKAKSWDEKVVFLKEEKRGPLKGTIQLDKEKTFLSNSNFMRVYLYTGAIGIEALRFAGFYCVYKAMRGEIQRNNLNMNGLEKAWAEQ